MDKKIGDAHEGFAGRTDVCEQTDPEQTVDYRQLIGFLTETIDSCLAQSTERLKLESAQGGNALAHMECAMTALDNTIRFVLSELDHVRQARFTQGRKGLRLQKSWLGDIFPKDDIGYEMQRRFEELSCD